MHKIGRILGVALLSLAAARTDASGQEPDDRAALGTVVFAVSCTPIAQEHFQRAVALLHHMTYPAAQRAFAQVAQEDPQCAMAHWGVAMTLFQPLWPTRPGPDDLRRGWEAVTTARSLPRTARESLYVEAAAAVFRNPGTDDYWTRIRRWARATGVVHERYPDDPEASVFAALALLALAPLDTAGGGEAERAADLLLAVYRRNPDHPGAMHYLVHANDADDRAGLSPDIVRAYAQVAPRNAHALHMPTHIYTRLGRWEDVIRGNLLAADAALGQRAGDQGQYVWDEFPHAIEYLVYAYLQQGRDGEAARQLDKLNGTASLQPSFKTAFHLASTRARYALERRDWTLAAALAPRAPPSLDWDRFSWPEAVTWFARGLGALHLGRRDEARTALERLGALERTAGERDEDLFARNIAILRLSVEAWLTLDHDARTAVRLMQQAAELERSTPKHAVTPAPTLPAEELLADMYMTQDDPVEALAAYRRSLARYPHRFNSLAGAARAARASGAERVALSCYRALLEVAAPGSSRPVLSEAGAYIATAGDASSVEVACETP